MTERINFDRCWNKFIGQLKGQLFMQKEKKNFSYPVLKLTLSEAITVWENIYDECGRWLMDYSNVNPQKAEIIKQILLRDIKFEEIKTKKHSSQSVALIAAGVTSAIGFGVSNVFDASIVVTAAATILPAAATFPAMVTIGNAMNSKKDDDILNAYIEQLEKYRCSIINVIEN